MNCAQAAKFKKYMSPHLCFIAVKNKARCFCFSQKYKKNVTVYKTKIHIYIVLNTLISASRKILLYLLFCFKQNRHTNILIC